MNRDRIILNREEVIENIKNSYTRNEIAEKCGCSKDKVLQYVKENNLYELYCNQLKIKYVPYIQHYCEICGSKHHVNTLCGKYLCKKHYNQIYRKGYIYDTIYDPNQFSFDDDYCYITIKDKKYSIDREDYDKISKYKWHVDVGGYCVTKGSEISKGKNIDISNVIFDDYKNMYDHINNDRTNNKKINLRKITTQQNAMNMSVKNTNTTGVTGIIKRVSSGKWVSRITYNYKNISLGNYVSFNEAVIARIKGECKYFKEYGNNYNIDTKLIELTFKSLDDNNTYHITATLEDNPKINLEKIS